MDPSPARRAAERYVEVATGGGAGALADLFAEDATFHNPDGQVVRGREAVRAYYDSHLAGAPPAFHIARAVEQGDDCWIELAADPPGADPQLLATDHFTVRADGLITSMVVFLRPRPAS